MVNAAPLLFDGAKPRSVMVFKDMIYAGILFHVVKPDILHDIDYMK